MGFLDFLTRKASHDTLQGPQLKGQAYESTAVALPPIRGGLPVTGNGPTTLIELKRAARKRSEAQLAAQTAPAPAPVESRTRSKSLGRPSTAPNGQGPLPSPRPNSSNRSRSGSKSAKNASSFLVNKNSGPPYLIGVTGPDEQSDYEDAPPVPTLPKQFQDAASFKSGAGSIASGRSTGAANGYIDILDVKGVTSADFRARVKATGARDYGEDVAERNMGINGVDLNSPAARAFYTLSGGAALAYKSDGGAVDVHGNNYAAGAIPAHLANAPKQDQVSNLPNLASRAPVFPTRTTSLEPTQDAVVPINDVPVGKKNEEKDQAAAMRRRRSLHESAMDHSAPKTKQRPLSMHPMGYESTKQAEPVPDMPPAISSSKHSRTEPAPQRVLNVKPGTPTENGSKSRETRSTSRGGQSIRSAGSWKKNYHQESESDEVATPKSRRSAASSKRGRKSEMRDDRAFSEGSGLNSENLIPPVPTSRFKRNGSSSRQSDSRPQSQRSQNESICTESAQQSSRPSTSSSGHPRTRSIGGTSTRGKPQLDDIREHIPNRRTSVIYGSVSSTAPTTVSSVPSSHQYQRPHSRHTADTSVDLGFKMPLIKPGHVRGKDSNGTVHSSKAMNFQRAFAPSQLSQRTMETEDYTTTTDGSDVEAYLSKDRRRKKDGEGLLFKDEEYGVSGAGLPGLFDNTSSNLPTWASSLPQEAPEKKYSRGTRANGPSATSRNASSRPVCPTWEDGSDTVSESDFDPMAGPVVPHISRSRGQVGDRGSSILSGSSIYDPEEEEMEEKFDVKMTIRLRKEMKRRERLATRHKNMGRMAASREAYEQGNIADSEP